MLAVNGTSGKFSSNKVFRLGHFGEMQGALAAAGVEAVIFKGKIGMDTG